MSWFEEKIKTDKELQDELRALCETIVVKPYSTSTDMDRYEKLLTEIYKRNLTPSVKLSPSNK